MNTIALAALVALSTQTPFATGSKGASGGASDHGALTGLADDDHTQYCLVDGTRAMTGALVGPLIVDRAAAETSYVFELENNEGDCQVFISTGTPESAITGSVCDLAIDVSTGAVYSKTSGSATNTGWVALASSASPTLTGTLDVQGTISDSTGNVTIGDAVDVSGNIRVDDKIEFEDANGWIQRTAGENTLMFAPSGNTAVVFLSASSLRNLAGIYTTGDGVNAIYRALDRGGNPGAGLSATLRGGDGYNSAGGGIGGAVGVTGGAGGTSANAGGDVTISGGLAGGATPAGGDVVVKTAPAGAGTTLATVARFSSTSSWIAGGAAVSDGAGTCTNEASLSGNMTRGTFTADCTAGQTMLVNWPVTRAAAPHCTCTPANAAAGAATALVYCDASTTALTITSVGAMTAGAVNYTCVE